ncbi:hypothetical protein BH24ACT22_BH24ACT22_16420 [soil metagenome]
MRAALFSVSWLWWTVGGILLVLCAVVLIGTYTFLPPLLGSAVGKSIKNEMGLRNTPEVSVKSDPPPKMLSGSFAQGQISLGDTDFGEVRPRKVTIDLDPFDLNMMKSMGGGGFVSREPLSGDLQMEVSEKEVARIADSASQDIPIEGVELEEDEVTVRSETRLLGVDVPVVVQGSLEIMDQELVFEPRRVSAFGFRLPQNLADELLKEADFSYPLEDLPYDARVSKIEVKEGYLILYGRLERIPLDAGNG